MNEWQRVGTVAQIIIAACAVFGLLYSLWQNREIAEVIKTADEAFRAQSIPVVKFDRYQWNVTAGQLDCDHPALGMNLYYRNMSGVPIAVEHATATIRMGERALSEPEIRIGVEGERILAAGESASVATANEAFPAIYKRLRGQRTPPLLNATLSVPFRSLVSGKRYKYEGSIEFYDDCSLPTQQLYAVGQESIVEFDDTKD